MREDLDGLLREITLVTIALAIGFGMALIQLAQGVAYFVDQILGHVSPDNSSFGPLTWTVAGRTLYFDGIVQGLVMLAVVTAVAVLVRRRRASASSAAA